MPTALRLLCVLAHPDDESLGTGGMLARYAAEGVATYLLTATRGERGWQGNREDDPGPVELGRIREAELRAAANVLGVRGIKILDLCDGALSCAELDTVIAQISSYVRQIQPHVVVTFGPDGATGHPDHIAISQFTTAALLCAADPTYQAASGWLPHRVAKLYYLAETRAKVALYNSIFGDAGMTVGGVKRHVPGWEAWAVTTHVDTSAYWHTVWEAISCHRSQLPSYEALAQLSDRHHRQLWRTQEFYRVYSLVGNAHGVEEDLFLGLR